MKREKRPFNYNSVKKMLLSLGSMIIILSIIVACNAYSDYKKVIPTLADTTKIEGTIESIDEHQHYFAIKLVDDSKVYHVGTMYFSNKDVRHLDKFIKNGDSIQILIIEQNLVVQLTLNDDTILTFEDYRQTFIRVYKDIIPKSIGIAIELFIIGSIMVSIGLYLRYKKL